MRIPSGMQAKTMDKKVYKLRRLVMHYVYQARELSCDPSFPRIKVVIADCEEIGVLGMAYMKRNAIFITPKAIEYSSLKAVVFHEILHAVYGIDHVKKCKLMGAKLGKASSEDCERLFKKYVGKALNETT